MDLYKKGQKMIWLIIAYIIASFLATGMLAWLIQSGRIGFVPNEDENGTQQKHEEGT